jgi:class 3 adenylate cyclase
MAEGRAQRRLAAIMAADVVGYCRLMGENEAGECVEASMRALVHCSRADGFSPPDSHSLNSPRL